MILFMARIGSTYTIIVEKSWESNLEKYSNISKLLGGTDAADCADAIRSFLKKIGLKVTLGELGIEEKM